MHRYYVGRKFLFTMEMSAVSAREDIIVFEVNEKYANRKGNYTVISLDGDKMTVRYDDGSEAQLKIALQERIWVNIAVERQAQAAKEAANRPKSATTGNFYIKTLSIYEENDLLVPGLRLRQAAALKDSKFKLGDRFIYYAVEPELFFSVVTITAKPKKGKAVDYLFGDDPKVKIEVYPIDIDAQIESFEAAVPVDATELESLPGHREKLTVPHQYHPINEDDFELLAELIMEVGESDEVEEDDEELGAEEELEMDLDV